VSGGLENPNNSLEARFKSQAQRQARRKEKQLEQDSLTGQEAKKLHNEVKTRQQKSKEDQLEIARLRRKIESLSQPTYSRLSNPPPSFNTLAGPSNRHSCEIIFSEISFHNAYKI
jgi:serine phosphatase RsbU (regulator of sigma subunit)